MEPDVYDATTVTAPQLSVNVGGVQVAMALHDAPAVSVISTGQFVITGFVLSSTIILKVQIDSFPAASFPVYVTGVVPMAKVDPDVCDATTVTAPQLSVNVGGVHVAIALHDTPAASVMSTGQLVITGFVLSSTIILKVQIDSFPAASFPVYVTGVVPMAKVDPDVCDATTITAPQLSVKVGGVHVAIALHDAPAVSVMSTGQFVITGFVVSSTITLNEQDVGFPEASSPR